MFELRQAKRLVAEHFPHLVSQIAAPSGMVVEFIQMVILSAQTIPLGQLCRPGIALPSGNCKSRVICHNKISNIV